jgi:hypothetical protein
MLFNCDEQIGPIFRIPFLRFMFKTMPPMHYVKHTITSIISPSYMCILFSDNYFSFQILVTFSFRGGLNIIIDITVSLPHKGNRNFQNMEAKQFSIHNGKWPFSQLFIGACFSCEISSLINSTNYHFHNKKKKTRNNKTTWCSSYLSWHLFHIKRSGNINLLKSRHMRKCSFLLLARLQ